MSENTQAAPAAKAPAARFGGKGLNIGIVVAAVVTVAAMLNALKLVGKELSEISVVVNGAGAAGIACTKLLMSLGLKDVVLCDRQGAIFKGREGLNPVKAEMAEITNAAGRTY